MKARRIDNGNKKIIVFLSFKKYLQSTDITRVNYALQTALAILLCIPNCTISPSTQTPKLYLGRHLGAAGWGCLVPVPAKLCFQSSFLSVCLGGSRRWPKSLGSSHTSGRPRLNCGLLTSAWPSSSYCRHSGVELADVRYLTLYLNKHIHICRE